MTSGLWREEEREYRKAAERALERGSRSAMGVWIEELRPWNLFGTLTFDVRDLAGDTGTPGRIPVMSDGAAMRRFAHWLEASQDALNRQTAGVVALEHHKSGQPHGHALLHISGGLRPRQIEGLWALWKSTRGNGYIRLELPRSRRHTANYCAKYITKRNAGLVFSRSIRV